jgi:hypothetical protein
VLFYLDFLSLSTYFEVYRELKIVSRATLAHDGNYSEVFAGTEV